MCWWVIVRKCVPSLLTEEDGMRLDREGLSSLVGMWGGSFLGFCCWYWHSVVPRWLPPDVTHNSRKLSQMPRVDKQRGRNSFPRIFTRGSFSSWVCWSCHKQYNCFHQALLFPHSWSMRWAGFFISHIMFGCLCGSAKTDVFGKLMNEERAGGSFPVGEGGGVIETLTPTSEAGYTEQLHTWLPPLISFSLHGTDRLWLQSHSS